MNLKKSAFSIQNKNSRDIDNVKDYPTISDLMKEQKISNNNLLWKLEKRNHGNYFKKWHKGC